MKIAKKIKTPSPKLLLLIGLAVCAAGFLTAALPSGQETDIETCAECHEDTAQAFRSQPHAGTNSCTVCHGSAEIHLSEGGGPNIFAFKADDGPNAKSKNCLGCHTSGSSGFYGSPHGKAALDCTTCHTVHAAEAKPALLRTSSTKNCAACHQDIFSLFQLNERHRLQEGILTCTACHNPHEPSARERLGGFKHESCHQCHTDKAGPFLFEHGASRIEGCTACHEVHGSPNRRMLTHQSISDLCFSCHTFAPSFHARFTSEGTNCTTCHATIHGSNLSKIFLK